MLVRLKELYEGHSPAAHRFRYGLLIFDICTILFVIVTSFIPHTLAIEITDLVLGLVILADFIVRVVLERRKGMFFLRPATWADIVAMVSFIAPIAGEGLGSCAFCGRFGFCIPISFCIGCGRIGPISGATKRWCWRGLTLRCSYS